MNLREEYNKLKLNEDKTLKNKFNIEIKEEMFEKIMSFESSYSKFKN